MGVGFRMVACAGYVKFFGHNFEQTPRIIEGGGQIVGFSTIAWDPASEADRCIDELYGLALDDRHGCCSRKSYVKSCAIVMFHTPYLCRHSAGMIVPGCLHGD